MSARPLLLPSDNPHPSPYSGTPPPSEERAYIGGGGYPRSGWWGEGESGEGGCPPPPTAPRRDYDELARALGGAPLLFPPSHGGGPAAALERRAASDLRQAVEAARRHQSVSVYVSFSEKVGLPLALLLRARRLRTPHVLIAHHLTSPRKRALQARTGWLRGFAAIVVLAEPQAAYLRGDAGFPAERVVLLRDSVDEAFWRPAPPPADGAGGAPAVLAVGRERRDYATLAAAARDLDGARLDVVGSSLWGGGRAAPALSFAELRERYARAAIVVVPLQAGVLCAAGANALLEAMAMGKAVVATETPGLAGYAADGETARVVPPGDPAALAAAVRALLADPAERARLGANARRAVETRHSLDGYVAALASAVRAAEAEEAPRP